VTRAVAVAVTALAVVLSFVVSAYIHYAAMVIKVVDAGCGSHFLRCNLQLITLVELSQFYKPKLQFSPKTDQN